MGCMPPYEPQDEYASAPAPDREDQRVLPVQSAEDGDVAWGELPEPDVDERFYRDRPPHW